MKIFKLLLALFIIVVFASCWNKGRSHIDDTVAGTPTYSDTVLYDQHSKHPLPEGEKNLSNNEYKR